MPQADEDARVAITGRNETRLREAAGDRLLYHAADLTDAQLHHAELQEARLTKAILRYAQLQEAILF